MFGDSWEDEPSQFVQDIAKAYCEYRPLYRPDTTFRKVLVKWIPVELGFAVISASVVCLGIWACSFFPLPEGMFNNLFNADNAKAAALPVLALFIIFNIFSLRWAAIDCVRLYQHYAPENVRRRCILMPRCSEFAIIVLRKYGFLIGVAMTWYRLNKRCRGTIYRIEYP